MGYRTSTALHVSSSSTGMQIQGYRRGGTRVQGYSSFIAEKGYNSSRGVHGFRISTWVQE